MKNTFSICRTAVSVFLCLALILSQAYIPALSGSTPSRARIQTVNTSCLAAPLSAAQKLESAGGNIVSTLKNFFGQFKIKKSTVINAVLVSGFFLFAVCVLPVSAAPIAAPALSPDGKFFIIAAGFILLFLYLSLAQPEDYKLIKNPKWPIRIALFFIAVAAFFAFVPGFSFLEPGPDKLASHETAYSQAEITELETAYLPPIVDTLRPGQLETPLYDRILNNAPNMRAISDAAYYQGIPRAQIAAILAVETNTVGMELRQTAEAVARVLRSKSTTSTGIAEIQLVNAVELLPRLYSDIVSNPDAPDYIRNALIQAQQYHFNENGIANIFDPATISQTKKNGNLVYEKEIADILQDDDISIYLCAMFLKDAMNNLHEADPVRFPDPAQFDSLSTTMPPVYAGALQVYYIEGPAFALNPNHKGVWSRVVGENIPVPEYNIYNLTVYANSLTDKITIIDYLSFGPNYDGNLFAELHDFYTESGMDFKISTMMDYINYWAQRQSAQVFDGESDKINAQYRAMLGAVNYYLYSMSPDLLFFSPMFAPETWGPDDISSALPGYGTAFFSFLTITDYINTAS